MSEPTIRDVVESYAAGLAAARQQAGQRGVELSKLQATLSDITHDVDELMEEFDLDRDEATAALERLRTLERMVADQLLLVQQQISVLDQGIRQRNNPAIDEFTRVMFMKNYLQIGTSSDPIAAHEAVNWTSAEREARNRLHDKFQIGMFGVGYGTARFVGSMTGASDTIAVVYGVSDEGQPLGWEMRAASFLSLVGGSLLSDAATLHHLRNVIPNRTPTRPATPSRSATDAPDAPSIATSQTSNLPSGTEADLTSMGIPRANFDKMQAYLFEHDGHVALRPTGVDAVAHLEAGAKPKPIDFKSKTSKDVDGLLGADPGYPGCAAAFDPRTDFFEQAMRNSGMGDAEIASKLHSIRAGERVEAPPGFDSATWTEALERFTFRKNEWDGAIGDGVRKMVAKGEYELRDGIIWEVNGPNGPRPVTGDHDPFELWIGGRPATAAEEAAFVRAMSDANAGIVHGGHIRFDPQPADYALGGRFDMQLDPRKYSPEQIEQQMQAKYAADRRIYDDIMEKHSRQALSDDVLRDMEGFEAPARSHYPDGPYGDLRYQQDTELHQRWTDLHAGNAVDAEVSTAEVLVLIGPTGRPVIMRAGETPAVAPTTAVRPIDFGPVKAGSSATLPRSLLFFGAGILTADPISYDDSVIRWYDEYDRLTAASAGLVSFDGDGLGEGDGVDHDVDEDAAVTSSSPIWKVLVGVVGLIALVVGAIVIFTGDDDADTTASTPVLTEAVAEPGASTLPVTTDATEPPPSSDAPVAVPPEPSVAAAPVEEPPLATAIAVATLCGVTTHSPAAGFASPSWISVTMLLVSVFQASGFARSAAASPVDDVTALDGATVTIQTPGSDLAEVSALVDADGVASAVVPISSYGTYDFPAATVATADGRMLAVIDPLPSVVVDAAEGPIGGCTPAGDLTDQQRADLVAARFPAPTPAAPTESAASAADLVADVEAFVASFVAAHVAGDTDGLFQSLHPAVIERHGAETCRSYVAATTGSVDALTVVEAVPEPWDYPFDGQTTAIPDSITVTADGTFAGDALTVELHLAPVGDDLAWFANCT